MARAILSLGIFLLCTLAFAQPDGHSEHLYPERLHADIELLRSAIHEAHPDPYRYHTRTELDALIDAVRDSIARPLSLVQFDRALRPIFNALGDSHCRATWPREYDAHLRTTALLLPLQIRILQDGVYLESELKGFRSIPVGSRILSINGRSVESILEVLVGTVITDGANRTFAERVVEQEFPQRYYTYIEQTTTFKVVYRAPNKEEGEHVVFALSGTDIARSRKPSGGAILPWAAQWEQENGVMWVTMRTLDMDSLAAAGLRPDKFIQAMLAEVQKNEVRTMVLDLRGAGGRELAMSELVFSAIAKTPFHVLDDMVVRSIAPPAERASHSIPSDFYASANSRYLPGAHGAYRLPPNDPRLIEHAPMAKAFQGKVYVVCDGMTRDAAAAVVMMARRTRRARVVGEETGSNAFGFTGGSEWVVTAPGSGMRFHVPLLKYAPALRGEGPVDRGEQPNHQAYQMPSALMRGSDSIRASLLEMIRELE